jgi:hypothetical protein
MADPIPGAQVGRAILEATAQDQDAFETSVVMDGRASTPGEAGQAEAGPAGRVLVEDGDAAATKAAPNPPPLRFRGQVGLEGFQGIGGGWYDLVIAMDFAARIAVAQVGFEHQGEEGLDFRRQTDPVIRFGMMLGARR